MPETDSMIEDGRAHHALQCAKEAQAAGADTADKYQSYAKNLPMRIKTNGLGAALAFVKAKKNGSGADASAYQHLYDGIADWLQSDARAYLLVETATESNDLTEQVVSLDSTAYRAVTREVLSLLAWMRRFADGVIGADE